MNIILLGPPGSGKGTQAQMLKVWLKVPSISTGHILREAALKKTPVGLQAEKYLQNGRLVPDQIVLQIIRERLVEPDCSKGYVLDGFPRTLSQADRFQEMLDEAKKKIDRVFNLEVNEQELVRRLSARRVCQNCGATFHLVSKPPKVEGVCDSCASRQLVQRSDDKEETIRERLRVYQRETAPLIDYYKQKNLLLHILGEQNPKKIFEDMCSDLSREPSA